MTDISFRYTKLSVLFLFLIIILNILITLPVINRPLYSIRDSSRQVHTAVITKDLYNNNFNIFDTKIYHNGEKKTYIEEFPLYNIVIAVGYKLFGENEIIGKIISLLLFQASLIFFFLLLRHYYNLKVSLVSVFIFSFSFFSLYYNDFFQPTTMDILLLLLHLYTFSRFIQKDTTINYLLWLVFGTLNFMERPIFLVLLLPIVIYLLKKYGRFFWLKPRILVFFIISLGLTAVWVIYGYYITGKDIEGFYDGYFAPLKIFEKSNLYYITNFITFFFESIIRNFSIIGLICLILGLFFYAVKKKNHFFALFAFSLLIQMFLLPKKVMSHRHYLVPFFLSISVFIALPVSFLYEKMGKLKLKNARLYFMTAFILCFIYSNTPAVLYEKSKINRFIQPLIDRISEKLKPDGNIIFIGDSIQGVWNYSLLYAIDRCGFMLNLSTNAVEAINSYKSTNRFSYVAVLKISMGKHSNKIPECKNINWLMSKYRLIDHYKDLYFLLNAEKENKHLVLDPSFQNLKLSFDNGCLLSGIIISDMYKKQEICYVDITFLWQTTEYKDKGDFYFIALTPIQNKINLTHKILGDVYPTSRWRSKKFYSETISIPIRNLLSATQKTYFSFLFFNPDNGTLIKPKVNNKDSIVIETDISHRKAQVLDTAGLQEPFKSLYCPFQLMRKDLFIRAVEKNYLYYINLKNIQTTIEGSILML